jgi:hypothetical protein
MKNLELENLEMTELSQNEKGLTNGGCFSNFCPAAIGAAIGSFLSSVGDGIVDGYNAFKV